MLRDAFADKDKVNDCGLPEYLGYRSEETTKVLSGTGKKDRELHDV